MTNQTVRKAGIEDFNSIIAIRKELALNISQLQDSTYKVYVQKNGFLLPSELTLEEFTDDLRKIYFVTESESKVLGYLRVDEEQEMKDTTTVFWFKPELKEIYFSKPHADIGGIAVLPDAKHHGIATSMLQQAEIEAKSKGIKYIFSFVTLSPITNIPSLMFHEKNEFERIAVSEPHSLFGIDNYQSFLYGKKLI